MRDVAQGLEAIRDGLKSPARAVPTLWRAGSEHAARLVSSPQVPVAPALRPAAKALARRVRRLRLGGRALLIRHREAVLEAQYLQERVADAAIALYTSACTLARSDQEIGAGHVTTAERTASDLYLRLAGRRFDRAMDDLWHHDDRATTAAADAVLA